jgi:predicted house-cleaning noncanonical NTP pyrophosphatase (MazG superfamily)
MKKYYDKLIRDRIPERIEEEGKEFSVHQTHPRLLEKYSFAKLREEIEEFIENPCAEEAADVQEILEHICRREQIHSNAIKAARLAKRSMSGGFDMGFILEWVED